MIAVDTNILLRFVLRDDEAQFAAASAFFAQRSSSDPAFVSILVVAELAWALKQRYGYTRAEIRSLVTMLLEASEVSFEDEAELSAIVSEAKRGDLADHLISYCATRAGCVRTVTFDRGAARAVAGMEALT